MKAVHSISYIVYGLLLAVLFSLQTAAAQAATSSELLSEPNKYDGTVVVYKGEAIGNILKDGANTWINLHDGNAAIGVFAAPGETGVIKHTGDYKYTGDIVSVRGIFNRACIQHGGDTDIHAEKITIVKQGGRRSVITQPWKQQAGVYLPAAALLLAFVHLVVRRFRKDA